MKIFHESGKSNSRTMKIPHLSCLPKPYCSNTGQYVFFSQYANKFQN